MNASFSERDAAFMRRALELAAGGRGRVSPNPLVGAVVVQGKRIAGEGFHQVCGGPHAEVHAIDAAGPAARGAEIFVTLEPCNHTGKTPPCTEKILGAGIRRVVSALPDPNPAAAGGHERLRAAGLDVSWGLLETEAREQNRFFLKYMATRRPFVLLKAAATLDGRLATTTGDSRWVTGEAARAEVHRIRHEVDGILVGVGTVLADDPSLTARPPKSDGVDPIRIVLDSRLRTPVDAKILTGGSPAPTILVAAGDAPAKRKAELTAAGAEILQVPRKNDLLDLRSLMDRLGGRGMTSLLIEGGGRVLHSCLREGIGDRFAYFLAPKLLGGDDGVPVFRGAGPALMKDAVSLDIRNIRRFGPDLLLESGLPHPY